METTTMAVTAKVAMKIQEIQSKYDQQKTHLASIFDDQLAKIETDYRKQLEELSAELFTFKNNQRKQRMEIQEAYLKSRREMMHHKHEAQLNIELSRQKECLKARLEVNQQGTALSGESEETTVA